MNSGPQDSRPLARSELPIETVALARYLIGKVVVRELPEGVASGPTPSPATRAPAEPASRPAPPDAASHHGLPSGVFFAGVAVTAVLAGVTVWSGLDAIAAKNALPAAPTQPQEDDVLGRARRTDFLLLGAGLAGVASAVIGIGFTSFRQRSARAAVVPVSGGAALAASLAF